MTGLGFDSLIFLWFLINFDKLITLPLPAAFIGAVITVAVTAISIPVATIVEAEGIARGDVKGVIGRDLKIKIADLILVVNSTTA